MPPSPERETVYDGNKYVRGYSATLVKIDGNEYSFEEIRAARVGYVDNAIDYRDVQAIKNREYTRRKWRESEMERQKQGAQIADEMRKLEDQKRKVEEERRKVEEDRRQLEEQRRAAEEEARRARLMRPRDEPHSTGREEQPPKEDEWGRQKKRVRLEDERAAPPPSSRHHNGEAVSAKARPLAALEAATPSQDRYRPSLATAKPAPRTPTMTFHTKKALEKVLPLFTDEEAALRDETGSLTAALRGGMHDPRDGLAGGGGGGRNGDAPPTPTATMNTKAAMASVLSMFSGDFDDDTTRGGGLGGRDATLSSIPIEDRENAVGKQQQSRSGRSAAAKSAQTPGVALGPRKALGLAVQKPKKTNREVLEEELAKENRHAAANVPHEPGQARRTFGDAVREVIAARTRGDEPAPGELTGNLTWDDTGLLTAGALVQAPGGGGFRIYEDPDVHQGSPVAPLKQGGALKPPKLDFAVFEDGALQDGGQCDTGLLTLPVLNQPQQASFTIFTDFDDNPAASNVSVTAPRGGGGRTGQKQQPDERSDNENSQSYKQAAVVDPWLLSEEKRLLEMLQGKMTRYPHFFDCRGDKAPGKNILRVPRGRRVSTVAEPQLELPEVCIEVEERVGEGAFATVYKVEIIECAFMDLGENTGAALKVLNEPSLWEWYIYHQICERVPRNLHHNFVRFHSIHMYSDKALTLMPFSDGTLQDAMNCFHKMNKRMDEPLVIYYTLEMLKIVEILHGAGIIHGDLKPDNFLIKNDPRQELSDWGTGTLGGWDSRGLVLIDYGRSIDTRLYPEGTVFKSGNHVEGFKCTEMTEGRPWTYQADLFGICGVVHCLLHGTFLEVTKDPRTKDAMPRTPFKRYHQADLWRPLFRDFLNVPDCDHIPDVSQHRRRFEEHLKKNLPKAKAIKTLLARQAILLFERDKKQK